ncbi:MAG: hypothetical protein KY437_08985 [Actinobacteria bacterium]|nr:hypothetical protein [Actinomycetota bacterium]
MHRTSGLIGTMAGSWGLRLGWAATAAALTLAPVPASAQPAAQAEAPSGPHVPLSVRINVEVVANDFPYYQASNIPAVAQVEGLELTLPLLAPPGDGTTDPPAPAPHDTPSLPATGPPFGSAGSLLGVLALAVATSVWRGRRRLPVLPGAGGSSRGRQRDRSGPRARPAL